MTGFAGQIVQGLETPVQLADHVIKSAFGDGWITSKTVKNVFLFVQVFEDIGLEVGTCTHIHDFKDGGERIVVIECLVARDKFCQSKKQVFQSQIGSDALVKGVFVKDHAAFFCRPEIIRMIARSDVQFDRLRPPTRQLTARR